MDTTIIKNQINKMIINLKGRPRKLMLPNGEEHKAIYAIVDLNDLKASHNEITFADTTGYPTENGRNINDRNYKDDISAQRNVQKIAENLNPETLISLSSTPSGTPIINKDGFVVSGNNRVMSLKLAAKQYPNNYNKYVHQLLEDVDVFGINIDVIPQIAKYPVLVRIDESLPEKLNTEVLAAFNQDTKKGERPVDKAIKLSSILNSNERCKNAIIHIIDGYDTFSDLYSVVGRNDRKKLAENFVQCGLIPQAQLPIYFDNGEFTENGKDYIETLLSAIILDADALKVLGVEGVKRYRQTLISSLPVLIANETLKEGSLKKDISDAIVIQYKIVQSGGSLSDYTHSQSLFSEDKPSEKGLYINSLLRVGKNTFKAAIKKYTDAAKSNEGVSLFGENMSIAEIFDKTIKAVIDESDRKNIEQLFKKEVKMQTENTNPSNWNFKIGDIVMLNSNKYGKKGKKGIIEQDDVLGGFGILWDGERELDYISGNDIDLYKQTVNGVDVKVLSEEHINPNIDEEFEVVGNGVVKFKDKEIGQKILKNTPPLDIGYSVTYTGDNYTNVTLGEKLPSGWYASKPRQGYGNKLPFETLKIETLIHYKSKQVVDEFSELDTKEKTSFLDGIKKDQNTDIDLTPFRGKGWDRALSVKAFQPNENGDRIMFTQYTPSNHILGIHNKEEREEFANSYKKALELGYKVTDYKGGKYGVVYVYEKDNKALTEKYFEQLGKEKTTVNNIPVKVVSEEHINPNTDQEFYENLFTQIEPKDDWQGNLIKERQVKQQLNSIVNNATPEDIEDLFLNYWAWFNLNKKEDITEQSKVELKYYKGVDFAYKNPFEYNKAVEELLDTKNESFTAEEKVFMSNYSGYGGLEKFGAEGKGLLYEYYTPRLIVEKMWGLAYKYGFAGGNVLEPSCGVGEFIKFAPNKELVTGYEINLYSAKIAQILYPEAQIIKEAFETIFIKNRASIKNKLGGVKKYNLVIGNPPYGDFGGLYAGMGEKGYTKAENYIDYFISRGLDLLESNGLLIMIVGAEVAAGGKPFLSKGTSKAKQDIMEKSILVDAYRLPNGVFDRTDVLSDIIVLIKK